MSCIEKSFCVSFVISILKVVVFGSLIKVCNICLTIRRNNASGDARVLETFSKCAVVTILPYVLNEVADMLRVILMSFRYIE